MWRRPALTTAASTRLLLLPRSQQLIARPANPNSHLLSALTVPQATPQLSSPSFYHTRAHPQPRPEYTAKSALDLVLKEAKIRFRKRNKKWYKRVLPSREKKGIKTEEPYRNVDETIEFAANMNLDPRRPGQSIRGSITLPHGSGKSTKVIVFTNDEELAKKALENGALHAGGTKLIDDVASGAIGVNDFQRAYATPDITKDLSKSLARLLGPRGLLPNKKTGTIFDQQNDLLRGLTEASSTVEYRVDAFGIIHVVVGKASFGHDKLIDNLRAVIETIQDAKPDQIGKGKKSTSSKAKNAKYWLKAYLTSSQGKKGYKLELKNIDPTSPFFLRDEDEDTTLAVA